MYAIAAIGLLTIILSTMMIASPAAWSRGIVRFAEKPYFHIFEITSRILLAGVMIFCAGQTNFPLFFRSIGGVFLFAGLFLIIIGEKRHRAFAAKSATFNKLFRPAGFAGVVFGSFIIFAATA